MTKKLIAVPIDNLMLLELNQAKKDSRKIIKGHGVVIKNFSNQTKNFNRGPKKPSIESPYSREKSLKVRSIPFFKSLKLSLSIEGNFKKNSSCI